MVTIQSKAVPLRHRPFCRKCDSLRYRLTDAIKATVFSRPIRLMLRSEISDQLCQEVIQTDMIRDGIFGVVVSSEIISKCLPSFTTVNRKVC